MGKLVRMVSATIFCIALLFSSFPVDVLAVNPADEEVAVLNYDGANLRKGPGTSYESYGLMKKGTTVTVLDVLSSGWTKVRLESTVGTLYGYVSTNYLKFNEAKKLPKVYEPSYSTEVSEIGCDNIRPQYDRDSECSLTIDATDADYDSVIKLCRSYDGACIRMAYVRRNQSVEMNHIPTGRYYVKEACGEDLRQKKEGNRCLLVFASHASYSRLKNPFVFERKITIGGYSDSGYVLELRRRLYGNVQSTGISEAEFNR